MQQIKFYRVSALPTAESGQPCEVGSLYFVHDDLNDFNDLYVCIGEYQFESYSGHLYWSDGEEGGGWENGDWVDGETGEPIDLSNYLQLTGGTMSGTINFETAALVKCKNTNVLQYDSANSHLCVGENTGDTTNTITLSANTVQSPGSISASAFFETSDLRKKNIKSDIPLDKCYDLLNTCSTVIYSLKEQDQEQIGLIAQEVEEFFPEVVQTDHDGFKSLAYDRLIVVCFKMMKDMVKRLEKLEQ